MKETAIIHIILFSIGVLGFAAANGLAAVFEKMRKYDRVELGKTTPKLAITSWISRGNYFYPIGLIGEIFIVYWIYNPTLIVNNGESWGFSWIWGSLEYLLSIYMCAELLIDMRYRTVTNPVHGIAVILAFLVATHRRGAMPTIVGGLVALIISGVLYAAARIYTTKFQQSQVSPLIPFGTGDMILAFTLGLITGFPHVLLSWMIIVYIGGVAGAIHIAISIANNKIISLTDLPLGPFLILGTLITVVIS
jgi:prepilin signal peptidase PulO-like enzyme (type II secretory pathway)